MCVCEAQKSLCLSVELQVNHPTHLWGCSVGIKFVFECVFPCEKDTCAQTHIGERVFGIVQLNVGTSFFIKFDLFFSVDEGSPDA